MLEPTFDEQQQLDTFVFHHTSNNNKNNNNICSTCATQKNNIYTAIILQPQFVDGLADLLCNQCILTPVSFSLPRSREIWIPITLQWHGGRQRHGKYTIIFTITFICYFSRLTVITRMSPFVGRQLMSARGGDLHASQTGLRVLAVYVCVCCTQQTVVKVVSELPCVVCDYYVSISCVSRQYRVAQGYAMIRVDSIVDLCNKPKCI